MKIRSQCLTMLLLGLSFWACGVHSQPDLFFSETIVETRITLPGGPWQDDTQVDVYYPAIDARFPIAIVLQGAAVAAGSYSEFGQELARHGYIVAIPNRLSAFPPGTPAVPFPDELVVVETLDQLDNENRDPTSPLFNRVDTVRLGLVGHSLGGFVGLLVIEGSCVEPFCFGLFERPEALQAGALYGTNTCAPNGTVIDERCIAEGNEEGSLIVVDTDDIPFALVQGSEDGIATPAEAAATFENLDGPRELIEIEGANHYGITNNNNPIGAQPDINEPTLLQEDGILQISQAIGDFLSDRIFGLSVSAQADRADPLPLKGQSLSGDAFIFLSPEYPSAKIRLVKFYLDGSLVKKEYAAPYDLKGTYSNKTAARFDTRRLSNGEHRLTAKILFKPWRWQSVSTTFSVSNPSSAN